MREHDESWPHCEQCQSYDNVKSPVHPTGLCGSADDDPRNDLFGGNMPTEWIKTWR